MNNDDVDSSKSHFLYRFTVPLVAGILLALLPASARAQSFAEPSVLMAPTASNFSSSISFHKVPSPVRTELTSTGSLIAGGLLMAGGAVMTGMCIGSIDSLPSFCVKEGSAGFGSYRSRNLVPVAGIAVASTGALMMLLPSKKDKEKAEEEYLAPVSTMNSVEDVGEVVFGGLKLRAAQYENKRVTTTAAFGGVCTLPGDQTWLLFPLHDEGVQHLGPCTMMSPVLGAILRSQSAPLDGLKLGDMIKLTGVVTDRRTMPGQNGQFSIEVEYIEPVIGAE